MSSSAILLESSDSLEREDREVVSELLATSQRASVMTKDLMMFAKEQSHPGAKIELNAWLRQALASLESGAPTEISLTYRAECETASISAHPGQIRQVVENLVNNAAYASKSSSEVKLLLSHTQLTPNEAKSLGCKPGPYARLLVKDQGIGMSAETLGRVFEPFFSTRGTTKGTGLGLAGVWAIIQQQEGHISAESQQQHGSVFKVLWPLVP